MWMLIIYFHTASDPRHWLWHLEIPFPGEFQPIPREVEKSPAPFPEADVAVIIMNCFVIAPMFAPPTKSSSEILLHGLRKHPIINTVASQLGRPEDQTGMEYAYVYKKESNWLVSPGSACSPI